MITKYELSINLERWAGVVPFLTSQSTQNLAGRLVGFKFAATSVPFYVY